MNVSASPESSVDPQKLNVAHNGDARLTRLLAWMLVLVLGGFVIVSGWFAYRISVLRDCGGCIEPPGRNIDPAIEVANSSTMKMLAYAQNLEQTLHALESGDLDRVAADEKAGDEITGWEYKYLQRAAQRCRYDLPVPDATGGQTVFSHDGLVCLEPIGSGRWYVHDMTIRRGPRHFELLDQRQRNGVLLSIDARSGDGERCFLTTLGQITALGPGLDFRVHAHKEAIIALASSHDGARLYSIGKDGHFKVWDTVHEDRRLTLPDGKKVRPLGLAIERDDRTVTTLGEDGKVRRWQAWTGRSLGEVVLTGFDVQRDRAALSPDGALAAAAGKDGSVRLWNSRDGRLLKRFTPEQRRPGQPVFSPDGKYLAWPQVDVVRLWFIPDERECLLSGPDGETIRDIAFATENQFLVGRGESSPLIWEVSAGQLVHSGRAVAPEPGDGIGCPHWLMLQQMPVKAVLPPNDRTVEVMNGFAHFERRRTAARPHAAILSPNGSRLIASCGGGTIVVWDVDTGVPLVTLQSAAKSPSHLAFTSDGSCLAVADRDGSVVLMNSAMPARPIHIAGHRKRVSAVWFGKEWEAISASVDGTIRSHNLDTFASRQVQAELGVILDLRYTQGDSRRLLCRTMRGQTHLKITEEEENVVTIPVLTTPGLAVFSSGGEYVASGAFASREVQVRDAFRGVVVATQTIAEKGQLTALAVCARGEYLAVAQGRTLSVYELGGEKAGTTTFDTEVSELAFGPAPERSNIPFILAIGTVGGEVRLWDCPWVKRPNIELLGRRTSAIRKLAFAPSGSLLASGDAAGEVVVWTTSTRREQHSYRHNAAISALNFHPQGLHVGVGCSDGSVWVHDLRER